MPDLTRRRSERVPASFEVTVRMGDREIRGQARNINLNGFFFETRVALPVGQLIRVVVELPDDRSEPFESYGWVRYSDPKVVGGAGVQLFTMTKEQTERWSAHYRRQRDLARTAPMSVLDPPAEPSAAPEGPVARRAADRR